MKCLLMFGLVLLAAARVLAQVGCGEEFQPPCARIPVTECYGYANEYALSCMSSAVVCNRPGAKIVNGKCTTEPAYQIPRPESVDFMDGTKHITTGYRTAVDVTKVIVVIPALDNPQTCPPSSPPLTSYRNPLQTVGPDRNRAGTAPNWAGPESPWHSRLAVNGSFYEIVKNGRQIAPYTEACTSIFGYTVSDNRIVNPEGEIRAYSKDSGRKWYKPATLVFYTSTYYQATGIAAKILQYPVVPGYPDYVPRSFENAISGTPLLENGAYVGKDKAGPDPTCRLPRTAVGLGADSKTLYLVVVNPGTNGNCAPDSKGGTTLESLAAYLVRLGARDAISLDGGGSAQMYYAERFGYGVVPIQTLPSDTVDLTGFDKSKKYFRPVGNFLGIR